MANPAWGGEFPPHIEWRYSNRAQFIAGMCVLRALFDCGLVYFWRDEDENGRFLCIEPDVENIAEAAKCNSLWRSKARWYRNS